MAKNHAELQALTGAMVDANDKVRSWEQFRREAAKITGTFRGHWLQAEYELAVAGGQMSSKWVEFERTGDDTMLRFSTVGDSRVSDICRPLDGVTKPIKDPFWDVYYPPNHFRCRSDVDRVPYSSPITADGSYSVPEIPKMMRTNLAKQGLVFPKNHPYYNGLNRPTIFQYVSSKEREYQFVSVFKQENGNGRLRDHLLNYHDRRPDMQENELIGRELAGRGYDVELLPVFDNKFADLKKQIFLSHNKSSFPDSRINGQFVEFEGLHSFENSERAGLKNAMQKGLKQADICLVNLHIPISEGEIMSCINAVEMIPHNKIKDKKVIVRNIKGTYFGLEKIKIPLKPSS